MSKPTDDDRRVRRTKVLLHGALGSLVHEKSWDDIVVKEILARADVGRSTFYTHFHDKDALLLSALRTTLHTSAAETGSTRSPTERVLGFSLPLLEHIDNLRSAGRSTLGIHAYAPLHAQLERALVDLIREELRRIPRSSAPERPALSPDLLARHLASTFLLTLEWWIGLAERRPAREADEVFHTLAQPAVAVFAGD